MPADLHVHTNYSDGTESPEEVVKQAVRVGLNAIAITDHDTVEGIDSALYAGEGNKVEVIPGIEFSSDAQGSEIHILGYFVEYNDPEFLIYIKSLQEGRKNRIDKIVEKLKKLGIKIKADEVFSLAGNKSPGRPHVARVLINKGVVSGIKEAFYRFLSNDAPAYVPHINLSPFDAIRTIRKFKGLSVFGHPGASKRDEIIPELMNAGLNGLEVYYPSHSEEDTQRYLALAKKYGLLVTGGSDYHGQNSGREIKLGSVSVDDSLTEVLKNEHARGN